MASARRRRPPAPAPPRTSSFAPPASPRFRSRTFATGRRRRRAPLGPVPAARSCPRRFLAAAAPPTARRPQPAWTPRAPPDGRHRPTGRRASGRPPRPAGSAGVKWPSKRSSAIGAGDSLAERPARPPAGLPPACPDPRLDRGAAPEPGSRQRYEWKGYLLCSRDAEEQRESGWSHFPDLQTEPENFQQYLRARVIGSAREGGC
nr:serine/arginine repetitive matrix protein 1-like [Delphinus delphis]